MRGDAESIFRREYAQMVAIARRVLGSTSWAEDVAQEAFVGFLRSAVPVDGAHAWLATATAHTALNQLRSDHRRLRRESVAAQSDIAPDAADVASTLAERVRVREVLKRLPRKQAVVLVLRHSGMSYQEISTALGIAVGSVGTTLRRAEATMRKELGDHGARG